MVKRKSPALSVSILMRSDGNNFWSSLNHSTLGSGIPEAQAVNFAVIALYNSVSPIRFKKTGGSIFCCVFLKLQEKFK